MSRSPSEIRIDMDAMEADWRVVRKALSAALRDHDQDRAENLRRRREELAAAYVGLWTEFRDALQVLHRDRPSQPGVPETPAASTNQPVWEVPKLRKPS